MRKDKLPFVKRVCAKGRVYEYFDTGAQTGAGKPIRIRLPVRTDPSFWNVYASLTAGRTRRANIAAELTVPKLIDLYERSPEFRQLAPATQRTYGVYLRQAAKALNTAPAGGVERRDILTMRDKVESRTGAANGLVRTVRALYAWARQREHVDIDPCKGIALFQSDDYEPWPDDLLAAALASDDSGVRLRRRCSTSRPSASATFAHCGGATFARGQCT